MHLHDNSQPEETRPLRCRRGEVFARDGCVCDLATLVAAIEAAPRDFEFAEVALIALADQIKGESKLNFHHVATMARADARRPLLLARTGAGLLLIDGRHRAARSKQLGFETSGAWIVSEAQWIQYSVR